MNVIDFPNKLRSMRIIRGWSQEELARRLGISRSAVGNYEQGTREPGFEELEAIADVFNCTIAFLIENDRVGPDDLLVIDCMRNDNIRPHLIEYAKLLLLKAENDKKEGEDN